MTQIAHTVENALTNLLHNVAERIEQANLRSAEREIARYLGGCEAKFTDESERKIERFLCSGNW